MHPEVEVWLFPFILFLLPLLRGILNVGLRVAEHYFGLFLLCCSHYLEEQRLLARVDLPQLCHLISALSAVLIDPLDKVVELELGHVLSVPVAVDTHNFVEIAELVAFAFEVEFRVRLASFPGHWIVDKALVQKC